MFDDLRAAFREALENFNKELNRDRISETADKLLIGMKDEIVDEKAEVARLEAQLRDTLQKIERLEGEAKTARRREALARDIDDLDTVTAAAAYAQKAESHRAVLAKKATALGEELAFRRGTVDEMVRRFHEAKSKRDALTASAGRSSARDTLSAADDLFSELDRMAEKIGDTEAAGDAAQAFDDFDLAGGADPHRAPPDVGEDLDVDAALDELKRRMGES